MAEAGEELGYMKAFIDGSNGPLMSPDPVAECLRKVEDAACLTDSTIVERIASALNDLEASYARSSDRIVALESVLHDFDYRRPSVKGTPFSRCLRNAIERRQVRWSRRYA